MVQGPSLVQQQPRRAIVVSNDDVNCAVIVNVAEGCAAAHFGKGKSRPCDPSHFTKFLSGAFITK